MRKIAFILLLPALLLSSCNIGKKIKEGTEEPIDKAVAAIDRAISQLGATSADWQDIMNKLIDELPNEVQSTITNEVSNLLNRGIAAAGAEVRCNVDFFRVRMRQGLQRLKSKILKVPIPPVEPQLCNVVPLAVDMSLSPNRRNKIEFYGYDFDMTAITVLLETTTRTIDVSSSLDQPTHYHMTLNLGASGVNLNANSKRLILKWNNRNISTIAVIQPAPDICETKFANKRPSNVTVIPAHATKPGKSRGDKEFDGHGPYMWCSVSLRNKGNRIEARVYVTASETKSDWTYGKAEKFFTVYNADPGYVIEKIVTPTYASFSYTDNDHNQDQFSGSGPVQYFIFNGDGSGDDIGRNTKVTIQFNTIRVQLKETGDCVSSATLRSLELGGEISEQLRSSMQSVSSRMKFVAPEELTEAP